MPPPRSTRPHGVTPRTILSTWLVLVGLALASWLGAERPAVIAVAAAAKFLLIGLVFMELWGAHRLWAVLLALFAATWLGAWCVLS